ncbi:MAG: substrate-binding domain-containing protein [Victivallales bacterium]
MIDIEKGMTIRVKHTAIGEIIRQRIVSGEYSARLPGIKELSEEFAVNYKTIQKSLRLLKQEGVLSLKPKQGIIITNTHLCIGVVGLGDEHHVFQEDPYYSEIIKKVFMKVVKRGDIFSYQEKRSDTPYDRLFKNNSAVNGLIIFSFSRKPEETLGMLKIMGKIPSIVIGSTSMGEKMNYVDSDNLAASKEGVCYLIRNGHRRIAFIGLSSHKYSSTSILRLQGYKNALKENGIDYDSSLLILEEQGGGNFEAAIKGLFQSSSAPTAIFGADNVRTMKALGFLGESAGRLAVVVYDGFKNELSRLGIPYGVIVQPLEEIGDTAITKLYELIEGKTAYPVGVEIKSKLLLEGSVSSSDGRLLNEL